MLVYVRPSNEALLRARVPGAQDQRGCHSISFIVRALEQEGRLATPNPPHCSCPSITHLVRVSEVIPTAAVARPLLHSN